MPDRTATNTKWKEIKEFFEDTPITVSFSSSVKRAREIINSKVKNLSGGEVTIDFTDNQIDTIENGLDAIATFGLSAKARRYKKFFRSGRFE